MATPAPPPLPEPLRLPRGSVRGFLALGLMGTFAYLITQKTEAPAVLVNATVVVLAFYFGTRGPLGSTTPASATAQPGLRRPRIVRGFLLLGFGGIAAWVLWKGVTPYPAQLLQVLEVLGGYVIGLSLSWVFHRRAHETPSRRRIAVVFRDLSAAGALALVGFACYGFATGTISTFGTYVEDALSLVITYYFGSRVLAH